MLKVDVVDIYSGLLPQLNYMIEQSMISDEQRGASLVEYSLILALIAIVVITTMAILGTNAKCSIVRIAFAIEEVLFPMSVESHEDFMAGFCGGPPQTD